MLLIVLVLPHILASIRPNKLALAIHLVVLPLALEDASIHPFVHASAVYLRMLEIATVD
jgi:hypothetical protein